MSLLPTAGASAHPAAFSLPTKPGSEEAATQALEECPSPAVKASYEATTTHFSRRTPPVSNCDTFRGVNADGSYISAHASVIFISANELLEVHPLKTVDKIVAISQTGRHVVLQQATRSCFPSAVTMLALDLKAPPLFTEMGNTNITTSARKAAYIQKTGLYSEVHKLEGSPGQKLDTLIKLVAKRGSGILSLLHPDLGAHSVVLDEVSLEKKRVTLRDPYHGWMVTLKLDPFLRWIGDEFIQLIKVVNDSVVTPEGDLGQLLT